MKYSSLLVASLLAILIAAGAFKKADQTNNKDEILMKVIMSRLDRMHFSPEEIDNDFSEKVYDLYLKRLDGTKMYLTQTDVSKLRKHIYKIDDEINNGAFDFFELSHLLFNKRVDEVQVFVKEIMAGKFDFDKEEQLEGDPEKVAYASHAAALKDRWRKHLKYQVLEEVWQKQKEAEKAKEDGKDVEVKSFDDLKGDAVETISKRYDRFFRRMEKREKEDMMNIFLNSATAAYDPHTNYFPPKDKEDFDIRMAGKLEGIGASLREDDGYVKVVSIVPGSASWKQGELEVNDLITKVTQDGEEPLDIYEMRMDNVVRKIRGPKGTKVILTVKKVDGSVKDVPIIRDVVIMEEGFAKSVMLERKDEGKVGLINLPRFYADFQDRNGRHCSRDVKEELIKLQKAGAEGIILDLRNNGGGSLYDVVKMAGLFIDEGPIVQVKSKVGSPDVMGDEDPSIVYDGPLVIMVNSFSASASEILAAAMQDYNRAIIVGSSTFGKGTVQRFIDLDRAINDDDLKPLGHVKMTTQKFYRINGGSTQLKGVTPDILFPDRYSLIDVGEREEDHALIWDEIPSVDYNKTNSIKHLSDVKMSSLSRMKNDEAFKIQAEQAMYLKKQRDDSVFPLSLKGFQAFKGDEKKANDKFKEFEQVFDDLKINNLDEDLVHIQVDSSRIVRNDEWHKALKKDIYMNETLTIMYDIVD